MCTYSIKDCTSVTNSAYIDISRYRYPGVFTVTLWDRAYQTHSIDEELQDERNFKSNVPEVTHLISSRV